MPTLGWTGTFWGANVPAEGKCSRLGTKRCSGVPTLGWAGTFLGSNVPAEEKCSRLGTKKDLGPSAPGLFGISYGGRLLPLNCCVWFWRHVVAYTVDCRYLCEDSVSDLHEDWPVNLLNCGGHGIHGVYGADDYRPVV